MPQYILISESYYDHSNTLDPIVQNIYMSQAIMVDYYTFLSGEVSVKQTTVVDLDGEEESFYSVDDFSIYQSAQTTIGNFGNF